jgi:hypothetical protein
MIWPLYSVVDKNVLEQGCLGYQWLLKCVSLGICSIDIRSMEGFHSCDGTNVDDYPWLNSCMNAL